MSEAFGGRIFAIDGRDLIAFAKLLAGGDHPVREVEHHSFEPAGFVYTGFEREFFKPNLFDFIVNSLSVIFGCLFILKVVHFILLSRKQNYRLSYYLFNFQQ